jgi:hypothetical protein
MKMNIKAFITTLVLGSSTMASADSVTISGSASVSLGGRISTRPAPAPVIVRDHRLEDPCDDDVTLAPVLVRHRPVVRPTYAPISPVWNAPFYEPHNTVVTGSGSSYFGWMGTSAFKFPSAWSQHNYSERRVGQSWFDLTEATRIDSGRLNFTIRDDGLYRAVKLQNLGNRGSTVEQIYIEFKDRGGPRNNFQVVRLPQRLDRNNPTITIDLDGEYRQIGRIMVYGSTDQGAAFKLLAM